MIYIFSKCILVFSQNNYIILHVDILFFSKSLLNSLARSCARCPAGRISSSMYSKKQQNAERSTTARCSLKSGFVAPNAGLRIPGSLRMK